MTDDDSSGPPSLEDDNDDTPPVVLVSVSGIIRIPVTMLQIEGFIEPEERLNGFIGMRPYMASFIFYNLTEDTVKVWFKTSGTDKVEIELPPGVSTFCACETLSPNSLLQSLIGNWAFVLKGTKYKMDLIKDIWKQPVIFAIRDLKMPISLKKQCMFVKQIRPNRDLPTSLNAEIIGKHGSLSTKFKSTAAFVKHGRLYVEGQNTIFWCKKENKHFEYAEEIYTPYAAIIEDKSLGFKWKAPPSPEEILTKIEEEEERQRIYDEEGDSDTDAMSLSSDDSPPSSIGVPEADMQSDTPGACPEA